MSISEADIAILIPTYNYRDKTLRAVKSALESSAGEIIVVDDNSQDGTVEALKAFSDERLNIIVNETNLGLWENHLKALSLATKPWIKFIQADDWLLPGGLSTYAHAAKSDTTLVWAVPTIHIDRSGETYSDYTLNDVTEIDSTLAFRVGTEIGWLFGSPSHMMLRSDVVTRNPEAWKTDVSSDLVIGSIAASKGTIVLLPEGTIAQGVHQQQDAKTQSAALGLRRMVHSFGYLRKTGDKSLISMVNAWTWLTLGSAFRTATRGVLRESSKFEPIYQYLRLILSPGLFGGLDIISKRAQLKRTKHKRKHLNYPIDLDETLSACNKSA